MSETQGVCARGSCGSAAVSVWCAVTLFAEGTLRVVALSDPERVSARATLFLKGECDHTLPSALCRAVTGVGQGGSEHSLSPLCREGTLTTGLSPLESLESLTQSCADTWRRSCQAAAGRIPHLSAKVLRSCPRD